MQSSSHHQQTNIYNIHKYTLWYRRRLNETVMWLSGRKLASRARGLGSNAVSYTFFIYYLLYYFTWNANRLIRHAGLSASAEFLVCSSGLCFQRSHVPDRARSPKSLAKKQVGCTSFVALPTASGQKQTSK